MPPSPRRDRSLLLATLVCLPAVAHAQVTVGLRAGAVASGPLVRDSIVEALTIRPDVAPLVALRIGTPLRGRYGVSAELAVSRSDLVSHGDTSEQKITSLTLWSPSLGLQVAATRWLVAEARLGALIYDPGETAATLFSEGSPVDAVLGVGLLAERAIGSRFVAGLGVQYDVHRFTTTALRTRGFSGETAVHRVAVSVTLSRRFVRATASR
jgi:hypothetical protein